jgi:glutathione peroxidase
LFTIWHLFISGLYQQYENWNAIKEDLNTENFDVLAIPCNHFNLQEPGANEVILGGLSAVRPGNGFVPNYRVAGKADANGASEIPLYTFLKGQCPGTENEIGDTERFYFTPIKQHDIKWNFEKFMISAEGKPVRRYNPKTSPFNMLDDIQEQLVLIQPAETDVRKSRVEQGRSKFLGGKP